MRDSSLYRFSLWLHIVSLLLWISLLGLLFAHVEIQIEGAAGWAENLPTWRIEKSVWLDLFWGGRPMTGYHAWVFSFMALIFHLPVFISGRFSLKLEGRVIGSLMLFWIIEDFLWFVMNPAYGIGAFCGESIAWHKHWFLGLPCDYWAFLLGAGLLIWYSFRPSKRSKGAS